MNVYKKPILRLFNTLYNNNEHINCMSNMVAK